MPSTETSSPVQERLLSAKDLAEYVGVPIGTIYRWNWAGTGPTPIHVGRHVRYRESDVATWLDENATVPAA